MIKICSWNINSIRNKVDYVNEFLNNEKPDILFISETKITEKLESSVEEKIKKEYTCIWNSNKSSYYHGTCFLIKNDIFSNVNVLSNEMEICSKQYNTESESKNSERINSIDKKCIDDDTEKAHKNEGRVILCEFTLKNDRKFVVLGTYSPNSGVDRKQPLKRLAYRTLRWDSDVYKTLNDLKTKYKEIFWIGDLNVAIKNNDMAYKMNIAGTTIEERHNFNNFLKDGWIDTFDELNTEKNNIIERCTYGYNIKCKLRLDYIICCERMKECIQESQIIYGYNDVSDHLPIMCTFKNLPDE
jgi:exodeoxyribonuclease III